MIEVNNLHKSFLRTKKQQVKALNGLSFTAKDGEITGILGPNGAGKTTCLRTLYGLLKADSGSAVIDGIQVSQSPIEARAKLGIFPDKFGLYERLTAYEQIDYLLNLSTKNKDQQWFYKPHPEELKKGIKIHEKILEKYPNVILLDKNIGHKNILNSKPHLVFTNHGKACHEFAYHGVAVINTGENPHAQYNFSLNPKSLEQLNDMVLNLEKYKSEINFDKSKI